MRAELLATVLVCLAAVPSAQAQSTDPRDEVYELATIKADHEVCGFPLSDEQQDVIAQREDAMVAKGDATEADMSAVQDQISTALQRQRDEGLCRPDGAEARLYKRRLTTFGLL